MNGLYRIAGKCIEIVSLYKEIHRYCYEYRCNDLPDFVVRISQADIDFERARSDRRGKYNNSNGGKFSDSYLEILAVYRKIAEIMPTYDVFLFHGSAIAVDDKAYLFTASSGTGKSTHVRLWREMLGERAVVVNDDKPLIQISDNGPQIFGTPWNGKHRLSTNICVPLKAVCLLERSETNWIRAVNTEEAYPIILQQIYRPINLDSMKKTMCLLDDLCSRVCFYRLGCNMDPEAAHISYETMKG